MIELQSLSVVDKYAHHLPGAEDKRVLIGCETSGTVRRAFDRLGFDAWSCDLLPSDDLTNKHVQCDVREMLGEQWDLICIMPPPCTRLCNSGVRWLSKPPKGKTLDQMWQELEEGAALFSDCWNAPAKHIAVENPVMHKHAKALIENFEPAAQTVQPWWFGERAFKATGLYLRALPELIPTDKLTPPTKKAQPELHKQWSFIHMAAPSAERWKLRSKTFNGIADAMADQWGRHIINHNPDLEL